MRIFSYNEKLVLITLVVCTLIMGYITGYFTVNSSSTYTSTYVINLTSGPEGSYHYILPHQITSKVWNDVATKIYHVYDTYDSYVIICNEDIIPELATALAFIIENLSKPIVITPPNTYKKAYKLAGNTTIPEVMIYQRGKLLRGVRTISHTTKGFISPHYPPLTHSTAFPLPMQDVSLLFINPFVEVNIVEMGSDINMRKMKNIILDATKMQVPTSKDFLNDLARIIKKGSIVVLVGQSNVSPKVQKTGVILGHDMTVSSAYIKLCFLLSNLSDVSVIPQIMNQSLRGEVTI